MTEISRKVKGNILFSLSMFVMLFIVLAFVSVQQLHESESFRLSDETIEQVDLNIRDLFRTDVDFYNFDLINPEFFRTGASATLKLHDSLLTETRALITEVLHDPNYEVMGTLVTVEQDLAGYDSTFKIIVGQLLVKGFKDYGVEGELRGFAHSLEDKKLVAPTDLLMLRRHEKDYLLRDDQRYVTQFNTLAETLTVRHASGAETHTLIAGYTSSFNKLVSINHAVGLHSQSGLKGELNTQTKVLLKALDQLNQEGEEQTARNHREAFSMFVIAAVFAIVFAIILIVLTARNL